MGKAENIYKFLLFSIIIGTTWVFGEPGRGSGMPFAGKDNAVTLVSLYYYYYTSNRELREAVSSIPLNEILEEDNEQVKRGNIPLHGLLINDKRVMSYSLIKKTKADGSIFFRLFVLKDAVQMEYEMLLNNPNEIKVLVHGDCWFLAILNGNSKSCSK